MRPIDRHHDQHVVSFYVRGRPVPEIRRVEQTVYSYDAAVKLAALRHRRHHENGPVTVWRGGRVVLDAYQVSRLNLGASEAYGGQS